MTEVKEQIGATATRIWSSVTTMTDKSATEGAIQLPGVALEKKDDATKAPSSTAQQNPLQFMLTSMFASCTSGSDRYETASNAGSAAVEPLKKNSSRGDTHTTHTPTSHGETSAPHPVSPSPLHLQRQPSALAVKSALQESSKILFKNNHEIAQEAIYRLRAQHQRDQAESKVTDSLFGSQVAVDTERDHSVLSHSILSKTNQSTSTQLSVKSNNNPSSLISSNNRTATSSLLEYSKNHPQSRRSTLSKFMSAKHKSSSSSSNRSVGKKNTGKKESKTPAAKMTSGRAPVRSRQEHAFFPASRPQNDPPGKTTRQDQQQRLKDKLKRNKSSVPKEVTSMSPSRKLKNRNTQRQKQILNGAADTDFGSDPFFGEFRQDENRDANDSWDIENDGISDITQDTVDKMVLAISQHLRVFPEEADNLNRIHSDLTDPAPKKGAFFPSTHPVSPAEAESTDFFPVTGGAHVAGFGQFTTTAVTPPRGGDAPGTSKGFTPPSFTRNKGSMTSRSFFTKTTHSTQTTGFASAWRKDEQKFWDTEVAKESMKDLFKSKSTTNQVKNGRTHAQPATKSPSRIMVIKQQLQQQQQKPFSKQRRDATITTTNTSITTATTPTSHSLSPKVFLRKQASVHQHEEHTSREVFLTDHDKLMDNLIAQNEVQMAEI